VRLINGPPEEAPERPTSAVVGLSTGWIPATVAEEWSPGSGSDVLVLLRGVFADAYRKEPEPVRDMYWRVGRDRVRPMDTPLPTAELSLLIVRWWDYFNPKNRRSRSHNVANEEMLLDLVRGPGSPHAAFAATGTYEVYSAFVRSAADLELVNGTLLRSLRGRHRAGIYFLWPTQQPAVERRLAGAVEGGALLRLMERMEVGGVASAWPHRSDLYRQLAGKLWVPEVCRQRPDLHVPATVRVDLQAWRANSDAAVTSIIQELIASRSGDGRVAYSLDDFRGVAKLGFSWMGEDVRAFTGKQELVKVLRGMLDDACSDLVCLVQERIENVDCEFRLVCCRDLARGPDAVTWELVRMKQKSVRSSTGSDSFSMASHETMSAQEAARLFFGGKARALQATEDEVKRLGTMWLQWFRDQGYGTPGPAFRLDFIIANAAKSRGRSPQIWTVELCECGGSLCGLSHDARTVAFVNECLQGPPKLGTAANSAAPPPKGGPFPRPLPPMEVAAKVGDTSGRRSAVGSAAVPPGGVVTRLLWRLSPSAAAAITAPRDRDQGSKGRVLLLLVVCVVVMWLRRRLRPSLLG